MPAHSRVRVGAAQPAIGSFLRSINVQLDAEAPARIAHFRPTAKAAILLEKLCTGKATALLVTAPYGGRSGSDANRSLQSRVGVASDHSMSCEPRRTPTYSAPSPRNLPSPDTRAFS